MREVNRQIRTPIGKVKGFGSAKEGTWYWIMQRLSALALIPLVIWFIPNAIFLSSASYYDLTAYFHSHWSALFMILFLVSAFYHSCLGLQVVIEDYAGSEGSKMFMLAVNKLVHAVAGASAVLAVLKLHLG